MQFRHESAPAQRMRERIPVCSSIVVSLPQFLPQTTTTMEKSSTIDAYIASFPEDVQALLQQVRATIQKAAPEATETINYGIPTFKLHGNLVHFAAFKAHIGFYPAPTGLAAFQEALAPYKQGKGSVQFPFSQPLPLDLIVQIVHYRVEENQRKASTKQNKKVRAAQSTDDAAA